MPSTEYAGLSITSDGPIRVVTLDRPGALNAVDEDLHAVLTRVWSDLADDEGARAVVLTGAGRAFCVGGDIGMMGRHKGDRSHNDRMTRQAETILLQMARFPLPVVAAVNGPAVGLGCSLALSCDIVLMAEGAFLCDPHIAVGLVPGDGGVLWPQITGIMRAKRYLLTGDRISAAEAVSFGMASEVVAADQLMNEAMAIAQRLAAAPAAALRDTKAALNLLTMQSFLGPMFLASRAERASIESEEHYQAVEEFQKRRAGG
jgi:enoyl-CoA hydratase